MLEADILEHRSGQLPVTGNVSMKGVTTVLDDLTAEGAFSVTDTLGREGKTVGKAYNVGGQLYFVRLMPVLTPDVNVTGVVHLTSQAMLIDEVWNGSGRTRTFESIEGKLRPIPDADFSSVVSALNDAVFSGYETARRPNRQKALLNCMIA